MTNFGHHYGNFAFICPKVLIAQQPEKSLAKAGLYQMVWI
jgi:hypothetical protein